MPDVTCDLNVDDDRVLLHFDDDTRYRAPVRLDPLVRLLVKRLDRFVTHHAPGVTTDGVTGYEADDLRLLGSALFNILFGQQAERMMPGKKQEDPLIPQPTGQTLEVILDERLSKHDKDSPFRIALEFEGDLLGTFPWEFMFVGDPGGKGGYFLSEKATLYRVVKLPKPLAGQARPASRNLKIVVAWALPPSLERLTGTESADKVIEAAFKATAGCSVEAWPQVHWQDFSKKFKAIAEGPDPIDILHVIAHGRREGEDVQLAFHLREEVRQAEEADLQRRGNPSATVNRPDWVRVYDFAELLRHRPPGLVFLHACSVGRSNPGVQAFRGAAELIAGAGVPVVVAMQYDIENTDADQFTSVFYKTIAKPGVTIDAAVREGRLALGRERPVWGHRRFATPVIFLQDPAARLVNPDAGAPSATSSAADPDESSLCPFEDCRKHVKPGGWRCGCEKRRTVVRCAKGHPNEPGEQRCWLAGCQLPLGASAPALPAREADGV
jgi:hypothetical protein